MKKIAFIFLIAVFPFAAFSQQRYRLNLNHVATLTFPDTPKSVMSSGERVFTYTHGDTLYIATAAPINRVLGVFGSALNNSYYTGVIKGTLKEAHGKLFYRKSIKMGDRVGVEFAYKATFDSVTYYCYHQAFNVNNTLIFYGYWTRDSLQSNDKNMRAFFGSLKFSNGGSGAHGNIAFKTGEVLGVLLIIGIIMAVGIGIVFLIRRMTKA